MNLSKTADVWEKKLGKNEAAVRGVGKEMDLDLKRIEVSNPGSDLLKLIVAYRSVQSMEIENFKLIYRKL